jgi:hypothetical protein
MLDKTIHLQVLFQVLDLNKLNDTLLDKYHKELSLRLVDKHHNSLDDRSLKKE